METNFEALQNKWNDIFTPGLSETNNEVTVKQSGELLLIKQVLQVNQYNCTLFELYTKRFIVHHSNHNRMLLRVSVNTAKLQNSNDVNKLTHSDDLEYTMRAEIEAYKQLMALPPDKQSCFVASCFRRLMNRHGGYEMYLQSVSVIMDEQKIKPIMLSIKAEHIPFMEEEMYLELRKKGYYSGNKGCNKITNTLQKELQLTQREMEIIWLSGTGVKQSSMAEMLHTSKKTIRNHSSNIRAKLGVSTLFKAWKLADRMGLFDEKKKTEALK